MRKATIHAGIYTCMGFVNLNRLRTIFISYDKISIRNV